MSFAQRSSGKWKAASASAISAVVADPDDPSPPIPSFARAASTSLPASLARTSTVSALSGANIVRHVSARVSEPWWNSDSRRIVFTSSGGGSMIRSKPYAGTSWLPRIPSQWSGFAAASRRIVPTTWRNIGPRSAPGSLGSWTFAPRRAWQTAKPPASADVVIQMSIPNLLMSSVQSSSSR